MKKPVDASAWEDIEIELPAENELACGELTGDDLILLDDSLPRIQAAVAEICESVEPRSVDLATLDFGKLGEPRKRRPVPLRVEWDGVTESSVAEECLAMVATEAYRARESDHVLFLAPRPASLMIPPPAWPPHRTSRLPPVSTPPMRWRLSDDFGSSDAAVSASFYGEAAELSFASELRRASLSAKEAETLPSPIKPPFTQRPAFEDARPLEPWPSAHARTSASLAPLALTANTTGRIVVRESPRASWLLAAAVAGALGAVTGIRVVDLSLVPGWAMSAATAPAEAATRLPARTETEIIHFNAADDRSIEAPAVPASGSLSSVAVPAAVPVPVPVPVAAPTARLPRSAAAPVSPRTR